MDWIGLPSPPLQPPRPNRRQVRRQHQAIGRITPPLRRLPNLGPYRKIYPNLPPTDSLTTYRCPIFIFPYAPSLLPPPPCAQMSAYPGYSSCNSSLTDAPYSLFLPHRIPPIPRHNPFPLLLPPPFPTSQCSFHGASRQFLYQALPDPNGDLEI